MTTSSATEEARRRVNVETIEVPADEDTSWCEAAVLRLADGGSVVLRLGEENPTPELIGRAKVALDQLVSAMTLHGTLPEAAYVEVDEESYGTPTAPRDDARFLLPHQDGAHSSFLTPRSAHDEYSIAPARIFSNTVYFKRPSHKMYQGFLITYPGSWPGETYYYDLIALIFDAYTRQYGASPQTAVDLEKFLGKNIAEAKRLAPVHRSRYLTLGSLLGSADPAHHVLPSGPRAESELWPEQYASIPGIWEKVGSCACGTCTGPGARLLCHAAFDTLGISWPQLRDRYEVPATGRRGDLLIGNNLTQMHAAYSARNRQICPVCIVMDEPAGPDYERWLGEQWEVGFLRMAGE